MRDEGRHFRNVLGGANEGRLLDADHGGVLEKRFLILRGVLLHADAVAGGVADDFVVHVGDVHDVAHGVSALAEEPAQKVDGDEGAEVADVSVVVDGGAAGVHADFVVAKGMELLDLRRHGIKKTKRHNESSETTDHERRT